MLIGDALLRLEGVGCDVGGAARANLVAAVLAEQAYGRIVASARRAMQVQVVGADHKSLGEPTPRCESVLVVSSRRSGGDKLTRMLTNPDEDEEPRNVFDIRAPDRNVKAEQVRAFHDKVRADREKVTYGIVACEHIKDATDDFGINTFGIRAVGSGYGKKDRRTQLAGRLGRGTLRSGVLVPDAYTLVHYNSRWEKRVLKPKPSPSYDLTDEQENLLLTHKAMFGNADSDDDDEDEDKGDSMRCLVKQLRAMDVAEDLATGHAATELLTLLGAPSDEKARFMERYAATRAKWARTAAGLDEEEEEDDLLDEGTEA